MKIDYKNVKYLGQPDTNDPRHQIELPQERGRGSQFLLVHIAEDDLSELQGLFGQTISLTGEAPDDCANIAVMHLVVKDIPVGMTETEFDAAEEAKLKAEPNPADSEPNPAKTEPDPNPDA